MKFKTLTLIFAIIIALSTIVTILILSTKSSVKKTDVWERSDKTDIKAKSADTL